MKANKSSWYVYLLLCDKKTFYVGITDNVAYRLEKHRNKMSFFTKKFNEIEITYCEEYPTKQEAAKREKQIKGWNRAKKQMLINGILGINKRTELVEELSGMRSLP